VVRDTGKYMTKDGSANLDSIEFVMRSIGRMEDAIFKKRREDECQMRIRNERRNQQNRNNKKHGQGHRNRKST
jgi:5'-3' exoribonuclease 2